MKLSTAQNKMLTRMASAENGRLFLADEPSGHIHASAWWRTMRCLQAHGLVQRHRRTQGNEAGWLVGAFEMTPLGRQVFEKRLSNQG